MTLFRRSKVSEDMQRSLLFLNGQFNIYGDPAYVLRPYLQVGFKSASLTEEQLEFNKRMSTCRVAVEWAFKDIKKYFTHVDMPIKLQLKKTPVGLCYYSAAIL